MLALLCLGLALAGPMAEAKDLAAIWQQIQDLWGRGMELEACQMVEELAPYKKTPVYEEAKAKLRTWGISIENPLYSYTLRRIVDLENQTESERARSGGVPEPGSRFEHPDAWGTAMRIELVTRPGFIYLVRSAGPDRQFFTPDDLAIGVRDEVLGNTQTGVSLLGTTNKKKTPPGQAKDGTGAKSQEPEPTGASGLVTTEEITQGQGYNMGTEMPGKPGLFGRAPAPRPAASTKSLPGKPLSNGEREVSLDDLLAR